MQVTRFFRRRVPEEERRLVEMFGVEYAAYAARTPIWIPTVEGLPFPLPEMCMLTCCMQLLTNAMQTAVRAVMQAATVW